MAAKKAPAKKATPAKKAAPKKATNNSGSANAAEKRMMDKKQVWASGYDESNFSKKTQNFGKKNIKIASKYGKPEKSMSTSASGSANKKKYEATTGITSKRGNPYTVTSEKTVRRFRPDKVETFVTPQGSTRARRGRDPKYGPAPKKK